MEYFGKLDSLNVLQDPYISVHLKPCKSIHETLHCKLNVYQGIYIMVVGIMQNVIRIEKTPPMTLV